MQYKVNSGSMVFETVDLNVIVGDAARIDVGEAINYIKTGTSEIEAVVTEKTAAFNLNATNKTTAFNNNAMVKTVDFNTNATNKTNAFNQNASDKTDAFDLNASNKTTAFNNNATAKTNDFNTNATNKTTAFNNNASSKTTDFNNNATAKTTAFNNNYTEKKALIDAQVAIAESSATNANNYKNKAREWAISPNVVDNEDYSSKYWAGKSKEWAESVSSPVNKNLSNLNPQGQNIANWSTNVANCITEIPQDIKLELNNGTLTLKAGSKAYVPNGAGVFDVVNISSDITLTQQWEENIDCLLFVYGGIILNIMPLNRCSSGASDSISGSDHFYYNTTNNTLRFIESSGKIRNTPVSLPIAIVKMSGNGATVSSIQQVFNGFGYIGSTIFVLPGVKGLIPNGRNEDGSLKNIESQFTQVTTTTNEYQYSGYIAITSNYFDLSLNTIYNEKENLNYVQGTNVYRRCLAGKFVKGTNGIVTSLQPKTAFHALDYNDSSTISGWAMPSSRYVDLNLGASGATYTAPANGYFCLDKAGTQNEYIDIRNNTTGLLRSKTTISAPGTESIAVYMPCKKGDEIAVVYTATGTTNRFRFIYAEGENV